MRTIPCISRRSFCKTGILATCSAALPGWSHAVAAEAPAGGSLFSAMGVSTSIDNAAAMKACGADFLSETVGNFLMPDKDDSEFARNLERLKASPLPILACNGFIRPAHLRCVGADATHDAILVWAEVTFRRLQLVGGKFIVFGSGGARGIRDAWPREKADQQFVALLKRLGAAASTHGVTVVVEQLQESECNYINHIGEAARLVREAGHPHVRVLADLFHMARMRDSPGDLKAAMDVVAHIEIAENKNRTYPGVTGDDFRPFFRVLRDAGYKGAINIEGRGSIDELKPAFAEIRRQAADL